MRKFLIFLIFFPIILLGGALAWVAGSQSKEDASKIELPDIGKPPEGAEGPILEGWKVFTDKGCVYCHGPNAAGGVANNNAQGGLVPALNKVYEGYSEEELKEKIEEGVKVLGKEDPEGPAPPLNMPSWSDSLSEHELDAVVAYLMSFAPEGEEEDEW